jgi:hypothetical protein
MEEDLARRTAYQAQIGEMRIAIDRLRDGTYEFAQIDADGRRPINDLMVEQLEKAISGMEWAIHRIDERWR